MAGANIAAANGQCTETRAVIDKQDDFKQAGERYRSWDAQRQASPMLGEAPGDEARRAGAMRADLLTWPCLSPVAEGWHDTPSPDLLKCSRAASSLQKCRLRGV
jgi:hypothetical protein